MTDEEKPNQRQRELTNLIMREMAMLPGNRTRLNQALPNMPVAALEELYRAVKNLNEEIQSVRNKARRGQVW